jgi:hypothetical protein
MPKPVSTKTVSPRLSFRSRLPMIGAAAERPAWPPGPSKFVG